MAVADDVNAVMLTALKDMGKLVIISVPVPAPKKDDEEDEV